MLSRRSSPDGFLPEWLLDLRPTRLHRDCSAGLNLTPGGANASPPGLLLVRRDRRFTAPRGLLPEWLLSFLTHSAPPGLFLRGSSFRRGCWTYRPTRLRRDCLNGAGLGFGVGLDPKGFPQTPSQKRFFASLGTYSAHFVRCRWVKFKSPSPKKPATECEIKRFS